MLLNYIHWNASPEIVSIGPITLRWYGLLFASGFLAGLFIVRKMFLAEKAPEEWLDKAFVYIVVGAVVGARLGHVFFLRLALLQPAPERNSTGVEGRPGQSWRGHRGDFSAVDFFQTGV